MKARFGCDSVRSFSIPHTTWDAGIMNFARHWYLGQERARIETLEQRNFQYFNIFTIKWSAYAETDRRIWLADTRLLGNSALEKLTTVRPHLQFHATSAMCVTEHIKEFQSP